jgi:hypothetical protein
MNRLDHYIPKEDGTGWSAYVSGAEDTFSSRQPSRMNTENRVHKARLLLRTSLRNLIMRLCLPCMHEVTPQTVYIVDPKFIREPRSGISSERPTL